MNKPKKQKYFIFAENRKDDKAMSMTLTIKEYDDIFVEVTKLLQERWGHDDFVIKTINKL